MKFAHDRRPAEGRYVLDGGAAEAAGAVPGASSSETAAEQVPLVYVAAFLRAKDGLRLTFSPLMTSICLCALQATVCSDLRLTLSLICRLICAPRNFLNGRGMHRQT